MDTLARALLVAADMIQEDELQRLRAERYAGWSDKLGTQILNGELSLDELEQVVEQRGLDPRPSSGRQERLENIVNQRIWGLRPEI